MICVISKSLRDVEDNSVGWEASAGVVEGVDVELKRTAAPLLIIADLATTWGRHSDLEAKVADDVERRDFVRETA